MYYFMFSTGSYSDYCVGGLFVCDHEVTKEEWEEHYKKYQEESSVRMTNIRRLTQGENWRYVVESPYYTEYQHWQQENDPEKTFQEKHNMKPVNYQEMWMD